jgi:hypothetical protein
MGSARSCGREGGSQTSARPTRAGLLPACLPQGVLWPGTSGRACSRLVRCISERHFIHKLAPCQTHVPNDRCVKIKRQRHTLPNSLQLCCYCAWGWTCHVTSTVARPPSSFPPAPSSSFRPCLCGARGAAARDLRCAFLFVQSVCVSGHMRCAALHCMYSVQCASVWSELLLLYKPCPCARALPAAAPFSP